MYYNEHFWYYPEHFGYYDALSNVHFWYYNVLYNAHFRYHNTHSTSYVPISTKMQLGEVYSLLLKVRVMRFVLMVLYDTATFISVIVRFQL